MTTSTKWSLLCSVVMEKNRADVFCLNGPPGELATQQITTWSGFKSQLSLFSVGGNCAAPPDFISRGDRKVEAVVVGKDYACYFKYANPPGPWVPHQTGWTLLGGKFVTPLSITSASPTRVDLFGVSSSHVILHKYKKDSDNIWSEWESLEGHWHSAVKALVRSEGLIDLVAIDPSFRMCYKLWNIKNSNPWEVLGGKFITHPAIFSCGPNQVHVFGTSVSNELLHKVGDSTGGNRPVWTPSGDEWNNIGPRGLKFDGVPTALSVTPGRLELFVTTKNGDLMSNCWSEGQWMYEDDMPVVLASICTSAPLLLSRIAGEMDLFVMTNSTLQFRSYSAGSWSTTWSSAGVAIPSIVPLGGNPPPYGA